MALRRKEAQGHRVVAIKKAHAALRQARAENTFVLDDGTKGYAHEVVAVSSSFDWRGSTSNRGPVGSANASRTAPRS